MKYETFNPVTDHQNLSFLTHFKTLWDKIVKTSTTECNISTTAFSLVFQLQLFKKNRKWFHKSEESDCWRYYRQSTFYNESTEAAGGFAIASRLISDLVNLNDSYFFRKIEVFHFFSVIFIGMIAVLGQFIATTTFFYSNRNSFSISRFFC